MEYNPDLDVDWLATIHRSQVDLLEQIRLSNDTIERSQELLKQIDQVMGKPPLKP
jgi:hypothetical protein